MSEEMKSGGTIPVDVRLSIAQVLLAIGSDRYELSRVLNDFLVGIKTLVPQLDCRIAWETEVRKSGKKIAVAERDLLDRLSTMERIRLLRNAMEVDLPSDAKRFCTIPIVLIQALAKKSIEIRDKFSHHKTVGVPAADYIEAAIVRPMERAAKAYSNPDQMRNALVDVPASSTEIARIAEMNHAALADMVSQAATPLPATAPAEKAKIVGVRWKALDELTATYGLDKDEVAAVQILMGGAHRLEKIRTIPDPPWGRDKAEAIMKRLEEKGVARQPQKRGPWELGDTCKRA